jgi:ATP-dependent protease HslVU (ClpYQ) peptidase subunit
VTTIATDGTSMAGDGLAICHGTIVDRSCVKLWRIETGEVVGCAGSREDALAFIAWRQGKERPKIKQPFEALVLSLVGTVTYHTEKDLEGVPSELPASVGSGMDYALAAMDAGASPERAVEIASLRNPETGGKITVLHLAETK